MVKNPPATAGDTRDSGSIPGSGRSPGVGNGNPLQYSCLKNPMDRGAWWATDHGIAKSRTQLSTHTFACTLLHWQSDSLPLSHEGSPAIVLNLSELKLEGVCVCVSMCGHACYVGDAGVCVRPPRCEAPCREFYKHCLT